MPEADECPAALCWALLVGALLIAFRQPRTVGFAAAESRRGSAPDGQCATKQGSQLGDWRYLGWSESREGARLSVESGVWTKLDS